MQLGDSLSNLLPYYGSAAMLYQAVTGRTLSGQELGTATGGCRGLWERFRWVRRPMASSASTGIGGGPTGAVWASIKLTQPTYPGAVIPKSFETSLPNGQSVCVHGNAT